MRNIDTCYFCTTPYQLLGAISLAASRKETADLYIDPQFKNAEEYAEKIRTLSIFESVKVIESEKIYNTFFSRRSGFLNHLQIFRSYLYVNNIAKMILVDDTQYSMMFTSSKAYMARMVYMHFCKKHISTELVYYDDGIGSYWADYAYTPQKLDSIARFILFGKKAIDLQHTRYLFSPELYKEINSSDSSLIKPIPALWEHPEIIGLLDQVFTDVTSDDIDEKVIIIDTMKDGIFLKENIKKLVGIYDMIGDKFGCSNVSVKRHPRDMSSGSKFKELCTNNALPFEVFCIHKNMEAKVLISYGSTAVAAPMLFMHQEPYVILLYRLVPSKTDISKPIDDYFHSIKKLYKNERFFIPESLEDLNQIIDRISDHV